LCCSGPWRQLRPMLAGASIYKLSPLVDRYWGSLAPAGGLTLMTLAQSGLAALGQMIERAVCMPVTPRVARLADASEYAGLRALLRQRMGWVSLFAVSLLALLVAVRPGWNAVLFTLLRLHETAAQQLWWLSVLLLGYLHVSAAGALVTAAFIALGDSRTPVRVGVVGFVISVFVKSIAFLTAGIAGLALATSLYYIGNLIVMWRLLEKRLEGGDS